MGTLTITRNDRTYRTSNPFAVYTVLLVLLVPVIALAVLAFLVGAFAFLIGAAVLAICSTFALVVAHRR